MIYCTTVSVQEGSSTISGVRTGAKAKEVDDKPLFILEKPAKRRAFPVLGAKALKTAA